MNKVLIILFLITFKSDTIFATLGCMDNSDHGAYYDEYGNPVCDRKNYRYVECECPCRDIIAKRGLCRICNHVGRPDRGVINAFAWDDYTFR